MSYCECHLPAHVPPGICVQLSALASVTLGSSKLVQPCTGLKCNRGRLTAGIWHRGAVKWRCVLEPEEGRELASLKAEVTAIGLPESV